MDTRDNLLQEIEELVRIIEHGWQADLGSSVCWFGAEGEYVRDNAGELFGAVQTSTEQELLNGNTLAEYLNKEWVNSHPLVYQQVFVVAKILGEVE